MAVYTDVTDQALDGFLDEYDIGTALSLKGIAEGVENSNYLLHTGRGLYILTLYEKRVEEADLPFFLGLMEHLAARGFLCPLPVRGRDGKALRSLAGRPAAIISFLDGVWVHRPQVSHCRQLGAAAADMHLACADYETSRPNSLSIKDWRPLYETFADRADSLEAGLRELIGNELDVLEAHWPRNLPTGIIHADLFPDNVFFLRGAFSGFIDFYFACTDTLAYELAVCLNAWCFEADRSFNVTKAQALLEAYQAKRPLSADEAAALPLLARGAALRFLLTRAHDMIFHDQAALVTPKDPQEYAARLRFHQSVVSTTEYGLIT